MARGPWWRLWGTVGSTALDVGSDPTWPPGRSPAHQHPPPPGFLLLSPHKGGCLPIARSSTPCWDRSCQAGPTGTTDHEHRPPPPGFSCFLAVWPESLCASVSSSAKGDKGSISCRELEKSLDAFCSFNECLKQCLVDSKHYVNA